MAFFIDNPDNRPLADTFLGVPSSSQQLWHHTLDKLRSRCNNKQGNEFTRRAKDSNKPIRKVGDINLLNPNCAPVLVAMDDNKQINRCLTNKISFIIAPAGTTKSPQTIRNHNQHLTTKPQKYMVEYIIIRQTSVAYLCLTQSLTFHQIPTPITLDSLSSAWHM